MTDERAKFSTTIDGVEFQWHGGEYIEFGYTTPVERGPYNKQGQPTWEAGEFIPNDVINVWDYEKSEPRIPRTLDAFEARCSEWMEEREES